MPRGTSAGQGVDRDDADERAEHEERHPTAELRGHRAASGAGTVGTDDGTLVTMTRGWRWDS